MNNVNSLHAPRQTCKDKDESIFQALMTAIVEHQLLPGSRIARRRRWRRSLA